MPISRFPEGLIPVFLILMAACTNLRVEEATASKEQEEELSGLKLSKQYCQGCHLYPEPELLDKGTWKKYVLPRMGYVLGIYENDTVRASLFETGQGGEKVRKANIFPEDPLIPSAHWEKIVEYYLTASPDSLGSVRRDYVEFDQFEVIAPRYKLSPPSTTLVHFTNNGEFYLGDANSTSLMHFNASLNLTKTGKVPEGAVHIHETTHALWITAMGSFSPTDAPSGMLLRFPKGQGKPVIIVDSLQRPVHSSFADLDQDNRMDIVISKFGKWTGGLSWWKMNNDGSYRKNSLSTQPGAIRTNISDLNNDGLPDIVALFGQGDEGIFVYYNQGGGKFRVKKVIALPSSYGSSYFDLFDFNKDGQQDIIYTAGDNGDYPPLMKPYHGIRIYANKGNNEFKEELFLPLNGAYKAIPEDFDGDGDMDIAAISFFPDFQHQPEEGFVYFENKGDMNFQAQVFPKISNLGRWLVMDASDWDQDGDTDIILGSLTFEVVPKMNYVNTWVKNGIPFVILKNLNR